MAKQRILNIIAVGLLLSILGAALLIAGGVFDPRVIGEEAATISPGAVAIGAEETSSTWALELPPNASDFALIMNSRFVSGTVDSAAGVTVGLPTLSFSVAVSPAGYVGIWEQSGQAIDFLLPWQTWPHVQPENNEIWVESREGRWTVRVNRELLWEGTSHSVCAAGGSSAGYYLQSWGEPAEFEIRDLALWLDSEE